MTRIFIYDTTLRDGSQGEGVNFSLQDKLLITRRLDELGVDFIEGGYPLSNPKDFEYFQEVRKLPLQHARVAAFGMTRRKGVAPERRHLPQGAARRRRRRSITIVGKTWDLHVREVLGTTLEENLAHDRRLGGLLPGGRPRGVLRRRAFLRRLQGTTRSTPCKRCAPPRTAGASVLILCDTNGGTLPEEIADAVATVRRRLPRRAGHPLPQRLRRGRGQHAGGGRPGRDAGAGHDQRHRRALRQRRPGQRHRQPGPEARPRGAAARTACRG